MTYSEAYKKIDAQIKQIDADISNLYKIRMKLCDDLRFCDFTLEEMNALLERSKRELDMMEQDDTFGLVPRKRQMAIYIDTLQEQIEKKSTKPMNNESTIKWLSDHGVSYTVQDDGGVVATSDILIMRDEIVDLPALTKARSISVWDSAILTANALIDARDIWVQDNATLNAPLLKGQSK